jgi:hypothetical protein
MLEFSVIMSKVDITVIGGLQQDDAAWALTTRDYKPEMMVCGLWGKW